MVVGVPDRITDVFVYEFKTTRNEFLMGFSKPVALAQADLYGYFFNKKYKRVQIYIEADNVTKTWQDEVNIAKAEEVLNKFRKVDKEGSLPLKPKPLKCKSCEFKRICILVS